MLGYSHGGFDGLIKQNYKMSKLREKEREREREREIEREDGGVGYNL